MVEIEPDKASVSLRAFGDQSCNLIERDLLPL